MPFWDGRVRLINKAGIFPTGLLERLTAFMDAGRIPYELNDQRVKPVEVIPKLTMQETFAPRYYQSNARDKTRASHRGVFVMGTGAGKSMVSAMVVDEHKVPTLIVAPDTGIRDQLLADYMIWFPNMVGTKLSDSAPIIITNIQALIKQPKEAFLRFRMLLVDEFHHAAAKSYKKINAYCSNAYYRFGFTGTFLRPDGSDMEMHGVLANVIFTKGTSELIEEGFLVRPWITIVRFELSEKRLRIPYAEAYVKIATDLRFNQLVANIAEQKAFKENKQTLILVRRIEHGELLQRLLPEATFISGELPTEERKQIKKDFIKKRVRCLIATNVFGEGIDVPTIDVLINARCQKTEIQTSQGIGRALRLADGKDKAEVFDFLIIGHKNLEDHSIERIRTYKREPAFKICAKRSESLDPNSF